jgi:hypothetical protein
MNNILATEILNAENLSYVYETGSPYKATLNFHRILKLWLLNGDSTLLVLHFFNFKLFLLKNIAQNLSPLSKRLR